GSSVTVFAAFLTDSRQDFAGMPRRSKVSSCQKRVFRRRLESRVARYLSFYINYPSFFFAIC
ncbi:MAG: hypothetical protein ACN6PO_02520, partial [Stenotrophomonas bentonitica]